MHGPASPGWLLVALCAATGSYCLLRMRSSVEAQRRAAGGGGFYTTPSPRDNPTTRDPGVWGV
ncbi:hypothetical protein ACFWIJ_19330, partial [Streptomyces sp. NPDC127079]